MLISDEDLRKLDDEHLDVPGVEGLRAVSKRFRHDLKGARDRMNQNLGDQSREPPGGRGGVFSRTISARGPRRPVPTSQRWPCDSSEQGGAA